jgi:hypothetical protein
VVRELYKTFGARNSFIRCLALFLFSLVQCVGCSQPHLFRNDQADSSFAILKPDGNIYTYDLEKKSSRQLTFDGYPYESIDPPDEYYHFFDVSSAWSESRQALLVGKNFHAYVVDRQGKTLGPYGERVVSAFWSPGGDKVVLVQIPLEQKDLEYYALDYNTITIIDLDDAEQTVSFQGNGPAWVDNDRLVYLKVTGKSSDAHQYVYHDVIQLDFRSREQQKLTAKVQTYLGTPIRMSQVSTDRLNLAVYAPGGELNSFTGLVSLWGDETYNIEQFVSSWPTYPVVLYSSRTSYRWSPTDAVLAVCTPLGTDDYDHPQGDGAIIFLKPDRPPEIFKSVERRCVYGIGWDPTGTLLAYVSPGKQFHANFFDVNQGVFLDEPEQSIDIEDGLWWSPNGDMIGAISSDEKVCLARIQMPISKLDFECLTDGLSMVWMP